VSSEIGEDRVAEGRALLGARPASAGRDKAVPRELSVVSACMWSARF
jgi:hypothetical protein